MDRESAIYYLAELEDDLLQEILHEWRINKGKKNVTQSWSLIPSKMLIKEWDYNSKTGLTHDKIIEKIQDICIKNYVKIYINTVLFGHTSISPFGYAECWLDEEETEESFEEWLEDFEWFACDKWGDWRISDYGLDKIGSFVISLLEEEDSNKKLFWIDQILSVAHQRSDLSSWFVEEGSKTLSFMFSMQTN
jgi:hypothetical protein